MKRNRNGVSVGLAIGTRFLWSRPVITFVPPMTKFPSNELFFHIQIDAGPSVLNLHSNRGPQFETSMEIDSILRRIVYRRGFPFSCAFSRRGETLSKNGEEEEIGNDFRISMRLWSRHCGGARVSFGTSKIFRLDCVIVICDSSLSDNYWTLISS